jgi:hypothetical protein
MALRFVTLWCGSIYVCRTIIPSYMGRSRCLIRFRRPNLRMILRCRASIEADCGNCPLRSAVESERMALRFGSTMIGGGMGTVIISSGQCFQYFSYNRYPSSRLVGRNTRWQSPQSIRPASIIIRQPLITTRPPTIIIKPPIIMILASIKRRKSTPKRLTNIASRHTSTRPLPTNILVNK